MRTIKLILLATLLLFAGALSAQNVKWDASVAHISGENYQLTFKATIPSGWHMYDMGPYIDGPNATEFTFERNKDITLIGGVQPLTKSPRKYDPLFDMDIGWYTNQALFVQKVKMTAQKATLKGMVEWMLCDDKSCLPPDDYEFSVDIVAPAGAVVAVANINISGNEQTKIKENVEQKSDENAEEGVAQAITETDSLLGDHLATEQDSLAASGEILQLEADTATGRSTWALVIEAILWGFAALLTPCVFPMVPMTVSFFMQGSKSPAHGRFRASMYGFFIVALYTLPIAALILITRFVGGETVTADLFNWVATHWIPNVMFFLIFMIFAASFFGAFEITMPSKLVNKSDSKADRGGLVGVFFMALTLVLVSFSCTGPIVGIVIIKSTSGGEIWAPIITMFAFSMAFALPFTLLAFFPALLKKVPQSGGWLNSVKVTLGFIEVALGFKFLSVADQTYHWGILDREVYLAIWIVTFTLMALYFLGKIKFKHDSEVKYISVGRLGLAILTLTFVVYLIPGMWGAPLKALAGYLPPMHTHDFVVSGTSAAGGGATSISYGSASNPSTMPKGKYGDMLSLPHNLSGFFDLDEAQEYARRVGKPVFVDITGHGCVNCREMEARVWSHPSVLSLLHNEYVIVALYVDDKTILPESEWITTETGRVLKGLGKINAHVALSKFGQNAQPYYIVLGDDGRMLVKPRGYDLDVAAFEKFLRDGVSEYKRQRK